MSFLFPLYLFGLFAIGLPIAFHLLRKTPRGRQTFSSLLFLAPTPPRLTRRSKLDHLLLLTLRALALLLIALAFARPFQRLAAMLDLGTAKGQRYVMLIDTSASMRRGDLWSRTKAKASERLEALRPQDEVALVAFDSQPRILTRFAEPDTVIKPDVSKTAAQEALKSLTPGWRRTDLGAALSTAADLLVAAKDKQRADERLEVLLLSDLQEGADIDSLQAYEWPPAVSLKVMSVVPRRAGNAAARVLPADKAADPTEARIRVTNDKDSQEDRFQLTWEDVDGNSIGEPIDVYTPPGQSRVIRAERPADPRANRLRLQGDQASFDNLFYTTAPVKGTLKVLYFGDDAEDDIKGLRYYLQNAVADTPTRTVNYETQPLDQPFLFAEGESQTDAVVLAAAPNDTQVEQLRKYIAAGGRVLVVFPESVDDAFLSTLLKQPQLQSQKVVEKDYALLGRVDFQHPLFAEFADPRFNDFTKIRFWKRRALKLNLDDANDGTAREDRDRWQVLARFDAGDPAIVQQQVGDGTIYLLATSWKPSESQLALSTKFVPLMSFILDPRESDRLSAQLEVGDAAEPPAGNESAEPQVRIPAGDLVALNENGRFTATDEPGEYQFVGAQSEVQFVVNSPARESLTTPLDPGALEAYGVQLGRSESLAAKLERERQMRDTELESQQLYWRWLLAAALLLLIAECLVAGWQSRPEPEGMTT